VISYFEAPPLLELARHTVDSARNGDDVSCFLALKLAGGFADLLAALARRYPPASAQ